MIGQVQRSAELLRVAALPRRAWPEERAQELVTRLTAALKTPEGAQTLRPLQAIALAEIGAFRGAFLPMPTGKGKTLVSALAPRMIRGVQRPLILVPAHLREKTHAEFKAYRRDWVLPGLLRVESYQTLSQVNAAGFLEAYAPDMIIADEADFLKNPTAAVTRRVSRYLKAAYDAGSPIPFVPMTGTITDTSIRDFAHLVSWALPRQNPTPESWPVLDEWARALDAHVLPHRALSPGALFDLEPGTRDTDARAIFRRRLHDTPGVVLSTEPQIPIPIDITGHVIDFDDAQTKAFDDLRATWITPDGIDIEDGVALWRHAREISTGFYSVWDPRAPEDWRRARGAWAKACRETLSGNRRALDTELQLCQHLARHPEHYPEAAAALRAWRAIEPSFVPNPVPFWISSRALDWIVDWARQSPGLIWIDRPAVGVALAARGLPFYANEGIDARTGRAIETHAPSEGSVVLARRANDSGRNLQAWNRNLVVDVPVGNRAWEQLIARTHRPGQRAERVTVDVILGSIEDVIAIDKARTRAEYAEAMTGQPTKITHATMHAIPDPDIEGRWKGARWKRTLLTG